MFPLPQGAKLILPPGAKLISEPDSATGVPEPPGIAQRFYEQTLAGPVASILGAFVDPKRQLQETIAGMTATQIQAAQHPMTLQPQSPAVPIIEDVKAGNIRGAIGGTLGLGTSLFGPEVATKMFQTARLAGNRPLFSSTLNPTQQAAIDFLRNRGVPLDAATVTGNQFLRALQAVTERQLAGFLPARKARRATELGLTRVSEELAQEAHPAPVSPESAGRGIGAALEEKIQPYSWEANEGYQRFRESVNDPSNQRTVPGARRGETIDMPMPVYVGSIKEAFLSTWEDMQWMPAADKASSAAYAALKRIMEGPDYITAAQAEKGLSGLKSMSRKPKSNKPGSQVRDFSEGTGAGAAKMLQDQIDRTVASIGGDNALQALQQGRAQHASMMDLVEVGKKLQEEPVGVFNQLLWRKDTGIDFLRRIAQEIPGEMPKVGRAFLEKLFATATEKGGFNRAQGISREWSNLGPGTKEILFPDPELRSSLDKFFHAAEMVAENPNPSGTAVVGMTMAGLTPFLHDPISGVAVQLGANVTSRLLFSPKGVRLLTEALNPNLTQTQAASLTHQLIRAARAGGVAGTAIQNQRQESRRMTATNPKTGQKLESFDGGSTWRIVKK